MKVYTIRENIQGEVIVVENDVITLEGVLGKRKYECNCRTINKPYYISEEKEKIYHTREAAEAAIPFLESY